MLLKVIEVKVRFLENMKKIDMHKIITYILLNLFPHLS